MKDMRDKLIKLLRELETQSGYLDKYSEYEEEYGCAYSFEDYLNFPSYEIVTKWYNDKHIVKNDVGVIIPASTNSILGELKRMEADGLVMIGTQKGVRQASPLENGQGPDMENISFTAESVVLTTKGKSEWRYFLFKAMENPVANVLAVVAIVISIIALFT